MEDDDEFGDLYTDVLTTFPSSSSATPTPTPTPAINLKHQSQGGDDVSETGHHNKPPEEQESLKLPGFDSTEANGTRVLRTGDLNLAIDEDKRDAVLDDDDPFSARKDELNGGFEDLGSEPTIIPGLQSGSPPDVVVGGQLNAPEADDWDSDSEDDLQIVLNDNHHGGPMAMDTNGMMMMEGSDDEEDGEPLVIVADDDDAAAAHQTADDQDWGEDAAALTTEGKEATDPAKPNGSIPSASKIGFTTYGYHPFHSQFKYVRPGATPLPGGLTASSGGAHTQVRPQVNMGAVAGRGRGDWRPPGMKGPQKGFHSGFWGNNVSGRGLEFTLPSHKTIFEVDIDSFEEKPWKYPGVDVSDFFNFGLNEDSWKDYCKQLEQLRLESTMQSKIRVYESGRAEQEFDPDMPPELAAATGVQDSSAENASIAKADAGLGDGDKGSVRMRPPLPTGRPIQVETGYGERLPSVDTRPPRLRDSDAVIEIILQGSSDDVSVDKDATEHSDNDSAKEDGKVDVDDEDGRVDRDEYFDGSQGHGDVKEDITGKRSPVIRSCHNDTQDDEKDRSPQKTLSGYRSGSRSRSSTENVGSPYEKRWTKGKTCERSPHMSSDESASDGRSLDYQQEDSIETLEDKNSPMPPSPISLESARKPSLERTLAQGIIIPDSKQGEKVEEDKAVISANTSMIEYDIQVTDQSLSSRVEPPATKEVEDIMEIKASRSSDNSKATGSSRDHKWHDGVDEEEVQNGRSAYNEESKRHRVEGRHESQRKDRDGKMVERNYMSSKGKEDFYSYRDWDPYAANRIHLKSEGMDRRKERDYSEASWQWRDEDVHGRRVRTEDAKKQDCANEMISRHKGKAREIDRSDKDDYHSRKLLDSGSWRGYHEKDVALRYREKDDSLKTRHKILDDYNSKRRKDEHVRREHVDKEDIVIAHRESSTARRKRETDDLSNQRRREDQPRIRDTDDHQSVRFNEVWVQRERAEQQRERDEWYRPKLSYEENLSRREREDGRSPIRSSRNAEEKTWMGHSRGKGEYKGHDKDKGRCGEPLDRMEWFEDDTSLQRKGIDDDYACSVQSSKDGKRSRQERSSARNDNPAHDKDKQRMHEKKHKDNMRKAREFEGTSGPSKRHQGEKDLAYETADKKVMSECSEAEHDTLLYGTGERKDEMSSDDEQKQRGSKRGRSKLERWTSHKERDRVSNLKLSSSSKAKEISKDRTAGCAPSGGDGGSAKKPVDVDKNRAKADGASKGKDDDTKPMVDCHLDTVEKLKWRSERFKLPLTNEKDGMAIKKMESEALPSQVQAQAQSENPANSQVKLERPARKRRWVSS